MSTLELMVLADMATPLWPLAVYLGAVILIVGGMIGVSALLGQRHQERATGDPYESGNIPTGSARLRFPVKYYLVAMFFVIFDVEAAFLFAWSIAIRQTGWAGYIEAMVFIGVLVLALVYLWRQGALDWAPRQGALDWTSDHTREKSRMAADRREEERNVHHD